MNLAPPDTEPELLDVTIRFSASLPDLLLSVPDPTVSTTSTLKQLIRSHLPPELSNRRIRLIHAGKSLVDSTSLSSALKLPSSRTPSRPSTPLPDHAAFSSSAKGKTPIRDPPSLSRIYIHCSIGDVTLSSQDLADEARLAAKTNNASTTNETSFTDASATTAPTPRGFDRLLTGGFTRSEVQSLRRQFLAMQAHTRTSSDMPSPTTLRRLEDEWLDNSNEAARDPDEGGLIDESLAGALDDMLWGAMMGFFWPVGCLWWLCREEGVWSRRRKVAVVIGVVINAGFGGIRWLK